MLAGARVATILATFATVMVAAVGVQKAPLYFERMVAGVVRNGGTVDKFIGDAVMAVFGGLVPLPNASDSALDAALSCAGVNTRVVAAIAVAAGATSPARPSAARP